MYGNFSIRIDLLKLNGAFMRNLQGKTTVKRCLIIPIDDNESMFLGEKGCYLNVSAFELDNPKYDDTHLVKPDIPKDMREMMSEEQRNAIPILGNMYPFKTQQMQVNGTMQASNFVNEYGQEDDLPF